MVLQGLTDGVTMVNDGVARVNYCVAMVNDGVARVNYCVAIVNDGVTRVNRWCRNG